MQGKGMRGESAKQVAIEVLRAAGEPLHTKEVAKRVIASGRCSGLKGKTPEATVAAMLAVGSKPGGPFTRVEKGTYTLAAEPAKPTTAAKRKSATKSERRTAKPRAERAAGKPTAAGAVAEA
jgi:hypothetical protein